MKTIKIILLIINAILAIHSIYFGIFSLLPFIFKEKNKKRNTYEHKFRFIIAARNEEKVLKPLIKSIKKQNYNKEKYDIYVIPNNCCDNTKKVAEDLGCNIIEPNFSPKTKGEVLNYIFRKFKNNDDFDTYVIFDADNVLDPNFLCEMNKKLNEGYQIVQGFRDTKNLYQNPLTGGYALFFYLQSLFVYETRKRMNQSASVNGTGYVVLKKYIDKIKYQAKTVTEDIELSCISALEREKIGYARDAIFYDEQASNFKVSMKQRKRWIQGNMQVWRRNRKNIFKKLKEKYSFQLLDMIFILTLPTNQAICFPLMILSYIFIVPYPYFLLGIIGGYLGEVLVSIFLIIYFKKNFKKMLPAILFFPIFHITWIPIYIYAIFNTKNEWEEIKHTRVIEIEEILGE